LIIVNCCIYIAFDKTRRRFLKLGWIAICAGVNREADQLERKFRPAWTALSFWRHVLEAINQRNNTTNYLEYDKRTGKE
jgi:hypothetical protein